MKDARGPYRSHTAGMSPREAAAWFARQAQKGSSGITPEVTYLNAGTPSCVDHERVHEEKRRSRDGEYYNNCTYYGGQGRIR